MNAVRPLIPKIPDQQFPLLLPLLRRRCLLALCLLFDLDLGLPPPYSATCTYFGVAAHVRWVEGLACKVGDPITELVVIRRNEAILLAVQVVADCEFRPTSITMGWQVCLVNSIVQDERFPPTLRP